jgi:hypothetical protein
MYIKENKPEKRFPTSILIGLVVILSAFLLYGAYENTKRDKKHISDYIFLENQLLYQFRDSEFKKNHYRLEALKCNGVKESALDSATFQLILIYADWKKKDSLYISNKYKEHGITDRVYQNTFSSIERK